MRAQLILPPTLLLCLPLLAAAVLAAPASRPLGTAPALARMQDDERLRQPVTLALADRPLGVALPELGKALGVPLSADRSVADDAVSYFCKQRPAAEVLPLLASHFGFLWRRQGDGYQLWQDLAGQQREAALRQEEVHEVMRGASARMERAVAVAPLTPGAREARQKEIRESIDSGKLPREKWGEAIEELMALGDIDSPYYDPGFALLRSLTADQVRVLTTGGSLTFSTADRNLSPVLAGHLARIPPLQPERRGAKQVSAIFTFRVKENVGGVMTGVGQYDFIPSQPALALDGSVDASFTDSRD
ncbi:MAG TPA: hypothetical protein VK689_10135, partial [Armatimonadota bacterium]|nr:hypothetical protein [Armatimonadota bacterium]